MLADARWGPLNWIQRFVAVVIAVGLSALSFRLVEDPVRHSRWLAAVPARSLALGASLVCVMLTAGWALARSIPALDGGAEAATPHLIAVPTTPATTTVAPTTTVAVADEPTAPPTTTAPTTTATVVPLVAPDAPTGELATLVASMQQVLATASNPAPVPSNLRPSLGAARNRALPYTQGCVNVGVNARVMPCEFGVPGAAQTILLYGDSHAVQWFEPLDIDRPSARVPPRADRQGWLSRHRRRGADARAAAHLPALP